MDYWLGKGGTICHFPTPLTETGAFSLRIMSCVRLSFTKVPGGPFVHHSGSNWGGAAAIYVRFDVLSISILHHEISALENNNSATSTWPKTVNPYSDHCRLA